MNKNNFEELESRRSFFCNAAKKALPFLSLAFLSSPFVAMASNNSSESGCSCTGGCSTACQEECAYGCYTTCEGSCKDGCQSTCLGNCRGDCMGGCMISCQGGCEKSCVTGCQNSAR